MVEIKHWISGRALFASDAKSLKDCVEAAVVARANLAGASLARANLARASLAGANLARANLARASLAGASLAGASLAGAKFSPETILDSGESYAEYCEETVPALLAAGRGPVSRAAWDCHSWENCPLHQAFGVSGVDEMPILLRPRAEQFLRFFDAKLLPPPSSLVAEEG